MDTIKHTLDGLSFGIAVATVVQWLPPIAALLSIIWTGLQIYNYFKNK
jgi:hypothetical protein